MSEGIPEYAVPESESRYLKTMRYTILLSISRDKATLFARMSGHLYFSLCTFLANIYLLKKERRLPLEGIVSKTRKKRNKSA